LGAIDRFCPCWPRRIDACALENSCASSFAAANQHAYINLESTSTL
jgi:hypothetical protein